MCASFGWVPGWQASHELPSTPNSFSPQASQNVEESLKVHWLPGLHGFAVHAATEAAFVQTALLVSSSGSSIVVLVIRSVVAAVTDSEAPVGASFARRELSRMATESGPVVAAAPPWPELTRKS